MLWLLRGPIPGCLLTPCLTHLPLLLAPEERHMDLPLLKQLKLFAFTHV